MAELKLDSQRDFSGVSMTFDAANELEYVEEILDSIFNTHLDSLKRLTDTFPDPDKVKLCNRWFRIFANVSKDEKQARNCLCLLMRYQVDTMSGLDEPFTDLGNCNRDLRHVLKDLDNVILTHLNMCLSTLVQDYEIHGNRKNEHERQREKVGDSSDINHMVEQIALLRTELEYSRYQLMKCRLTTAQSAQQICEKTSMSDPEIKTQRSRKAMPVIADNEGNNEIDAENGGCDVIEAFKKILCGRIHEFIKDLESTDDKNFGIEFKLFEKILANFVVCDADFLVDIQMLDQRFENILQEYFRRQLEEREQMIAKYVAVKYANIRKKIRNKYRGRMKNLTYAHLLQIKLMRLKLFSKLRNLFLSYFNGEQQDLWNVLIQMEGTYEKIVDEI